MRPAGTHETRREAATRDLWLHARVELANAILFVHLDQRPDEAFAAICIFMRSSKNRARQVWKTGDLARHRRKRTFHAPLFPAFAMTFARCAGKVRMVATARPISLCGPPTTAGSTNALVSVAETSPATRATCRGDRALGGAKANIRRAYPTMNDSRAVRRPSGRGTAARAMMTALQKLNV